MPFHNALGDRQAEARAPLPCGRLRAGAVVDPEDRIQLILGNALAFVLHGNPPLLAPNLRPDANHALRI